MAESVLEKDTVSVDVEELASPSSVAAVVMDTWNARACCTVAGAWMVQFCTFGYINAFGVYQDFYTTTFLAHYSTSDISWIGSVQLFLMYALGFFVGRAFDAGYFHHLQLGGATLYIFSLFMLSLTQQNQYYQVFLSQGIGMGLGLGLTFLPSLSIISHHFKARRALATGIVMTGASAGGIVFPILLNSLFSNPGIGFHNGVRASGGMTAGLLLFANALMRTNPAMVAAKKAGGGGGSRPEFKSVIGDAAYLLSIAGAFFTVLGIFMPFFYFQLLVTEKGVDPSMTRYALTFLNAGSVAGRILPPFLADYFGVYNVLLPSMAASAVMLFAMFGVKTLAGMIIVGLLFGFFSGAYISLVPALLARMCKDMSELGVRMGFAFSVVALATLTGNPMAGAILGVGQEGRQNLAWWAAIVFAGLCATVGLLFMTASRIAFSRSRTSKVA